MHDRFSTVDGFVEVNECLAEMIKYVANEPSLGLYYIQQHTHNAVPNLLHLKDRVADRSRETTLHTEDLEDSIVMVGSMKDCGLSIADDMVKDVKNSLFVMSTSQPQRGLIRTWSSGFHMGKSSSRGSTAFGHGAVFAQGGESSGSYFSTVLKSAKQKAASIKWPQIDTKHPIGNNSDKLPSSKQSLAGAVYIAASTLPDAEVEELPLSSQILNEQVEVTSLSDKNSPTHDLSSASEKYEEFKANKEAKLEEWLEESENLNKCKETSNLKEYKVEKT